MPIKLIVTDMDGTLLNHKIEFTQRSKNAIELAQNAGIEVAIATGRTIDSGYSIVQEKGISCPFIELNGARMFDENEDLVFTHEIARKDVQELIKILNFYKLQNEFVTQNGTYANRTIDEYLHSFKTSLQSINRTMTDQEIENYAHKYLDDFNIRLVNDYEFLQTEPELQILKSFVHAHGKDDLLQEVQTIVEKELPDLIVTSSGKDNIEMNHKFAHKGRAVSELATLRGYRPDEVITVGDNLNDITMLEWSNHSYAVDNAHHQAKTAARYWAPSHEEDAVAQIIERVVNNDSLIF